MIITITQLESLEELLDEKYALAIKTDEELGNDENLCIVIAEAHFLLEHKTTLRHAAKIFGRCKSSIHNDMRIILPQLDKELADKVSELFETNLAERSHRGGKEAKLKRLNKE